jgi:D-3-phosphoglycerate dehydrogenase
VKTSQGERSVAGTLFGNGDAAPGRMFGIKVEADLEGNMLYIVNEDAPGFIGRSARSRRRCRAAGRDTGINIGTFHLGRREAGGEAVLLLSVDAPVTNSRVYRRRLRNMRPA